MNDQLLQFAASLVGGLIGSYAAVSVKLSWLRRDVDLAHKRLNEHDDILFQPVVRK